MLAHPVQAYLAGEKLKTMLTAYLGQGVKYLSLARCEDFASRKAR